MFQSEKLQYIIIREFRELMKLFPKENTECKSLRGVPVFSGMFLETCT